jgi:hypothetical protein
MVSRSLDMYNLGQRGKGESRRETKGERLLRGRGRRGGRKR